MRARVRRPSPAVKDRVLGELLGVVDLGQFRREVAEVRKRMACFHVINRRQRAKARRQAA